MAQVLTVKYNGITLEYNTLTYTQRPVYHADGRTVMYVEMDAKISGWMFGTTTKELGEKLTAARLALAIPRKLLVIDEGGQETMRSRGDLEHEINWGPLPGDFEVQQISGGLAVKYNWSVKYHGVPFTPISKGTQADDANAAKTFYEAFSFTSEYSIDADGYQTRTISGIHIVPAAQVPADYSRAGQDKRKWIGDQIPCLKGYKRESQTYGLSDDARTLSFSIVDREVYYALPPPVSSGSALFTCSYTMGGKGTFSLSGSFKGGVNTSKKAIFDEILKLAEAKLPGVVNQAAAPGGAPSPSSSATKAKARAIFQRAEISEEVYTNTINFSFIVTYPVNPKWLNDPGANGKINLAKLGFPPGLFAKPPNGDNINQFIGPRGWGVNQAILFPTCHDIADRMPAIADWTNPTNTMTVPDGKGDLPVQPTNTGGGGSSRANDGGKSDGAGSKPPVPQAVPTPKDDKANDLPQDALSQSHLEAPYLSYQEQVSYEIDSGIVVLQPKDTANAPYVHQSRPPVLRVIQSGYCVRAVAQERMGDISPAAPAPAITGAVMLQCSIEPSAPVLREYGIYEMKLFWRYVMQASTKDVDRAHWPKDPITVFGETLDVEVRADPKVISGMVGTPF